MGEIFTGLMGLVFLICACMQFQCKGPIWSVEYVAASPAKRRKLRIKQEYYWNGITCLLVGILFILTMIYTLTQMKPFLYLLFIMSAILFAQIICGSIRATNKAMRKQMKNASKKKMEDE